MLAAGIFVAVIGWLIGVHTPWYGILIINALTLAYCGSNKVRMMELGAIAVILLAIVFTVFMWISGFAFGAVTFGGVGEMLSFLFTGS